MNGKIEAYWQPRNCGTNGIGLLHSFFWDKIILADAVGLIAWP